MFYRSIVSVKKRRKAITDLKSTQKNRLYLILSSNMAYVDISNLVYSLLLSLFLTMLFAMPITVISTYLQFSNQTENYKIQHATNNATLISKDLVALPSHRFTICGSMYIGFFRGNKAFYTVRKNGEDRVWFTLLINNQDTKKSSYTTRLDYFGLTVFSNTGAKLGLRPHSWSHALYHSGLGQGPCLGRHQWHSHPLHHN